MSHGSKSIVIVANIHWPGEQWLEKSDQIKTRPTGVSKQQNLDRSDGWNHSMASSFQSYLTEFSQAMKDCRIVHRIWIPGISGSRSCELRCCKGISDYTSTWSLLYKIKWVWNNFWIRNAGTKFLSDPKIVSMPALFRSGIPPCSNPRIQIYGNYIHIWKAYIGCKGLRIDWIVFDLESLRNFNHNYLIAPLVC